MSLQPRDIHSPRFRRPELSEKSQSLLVGSETAVDVVCVIYSAATVLFCWSCDVAAKASASGKYRRLQRFGRTGRVEMQSRQPLRGSPPPTRRGRRQARLPQVGCRPALEAQPYLLPRLRERIQYSVAAKQTIKLSAYVSGAGYGPEMRVWSIAWSKRTAPPVTVASSNPQMRSAIPIAPRTPPAIISAPARRRARSAPSRQSRSHATKRIVGEHDRVHPRPHRSVDARAGRRARSARRRRRARAGRRTASVSTGVRSMRRLFSAT